MKRFYLSIIFLLSIINYSNGQVNYVFNPGFEILYSCPSGGSQIDTATGWSHLMAGGGGSPDLFHICCTYPPICGVPYQSGWNSFQNTHSGNGYAGIYVIKSTEPDNYRELIQSKLVRKLKAGTRYCVKYYSSLREGTSAYITTLGAYLDNGDIMALSWIGLPYANSLMQPAIPQVYNATQPLNDSINWMKIEGSFVANGTEEYITVGNFFTDTPSGVVVMYQHTYWFSYYYIDDVSVIETSLPAYAGNDTIIHNVGDSVFIGRQPEVGLNEDCIWFVNGVPIDTIAGMWVKPDTTTTYVLQQDICGNVKYDTVTVTVSGVGIGEYGWGRKIRVYPNPAWDFLFIDGLPDYATAEIYSINGKLLLNVAIKNLQIEIRSLSDGMYFIKLNTTEGNVVRKFVKK
jgi:hypothetical protein